MATDDAPVVAPPDDGTWTEPAEPAAPPSAEPEEVVVAPRPAVRMRRRLDKPQDRTDGGEMRKLMLAVLVVVAASMLCTDASRALRPRSFAGATQDTNAIDRFMRFMHRR